MTAHTDSRLSAIPRLRHGFFSRQGGVSQGLYDSANCGPLSADDPDRVDENRSRAMAALGLPAQALATLAQVHGREVVTVREPWPAREAPRADALVTDRPNIALGILAADCAPVLMAGPRGNIIGAAHAGWRGAVAGVLEATLEAMEALGASRKGITAAVGPTISQPHYEVGPDFEETVLDADREAAPFFAPPAAQQGSSGEPPEGQASGGKRLFDLPGYIVRRLQRAGVLIISAGQPCPYPLENGFFSARRARQSGHVDFGRNLSAIARLEAV